MGDITAMLSSYMENDKLSETELEQLLSLLSRHSPSEKETTLMADFMIQFLLCNIWISGIIGILLLGLLAVLFVPL